MKARKKQQDRHNPETRAVWLAGQVPVRFRLPREMAQQMREVAQREVLPLSAWIRTILLRELRRAKKAA